jgi:hypothetical protein
VNVVSTTRWSGLVGAVQAVSTSDSGSGSAAAVRVPAASWSISAGGSAMMAAAVTDPYP